MNKRLRAFLIFLVLLTSGISIKADNNFMPSFAASIMGTSIGNAITNRGSSRKEVHYYNHNSDSKDNSFAHKSMPLEEMSKKELEEHIKDLENRLTVARAVLSTKE